MKLNEKQSKMVENNMNLVYYTLHKYFKLLYCKDNKTCDEDLNQVGFEGLCKAAYYFKEELGYKFATYAVPMIMGEVQRYIRDDRPYRIPRSLKDLAYSILRFKKDFEGKEFREPNVEEIALALCKTVEEINFAITSINDTISLHTEIEKTTEKNQLMLIEVIEDKKCNSDYDNADLKADIDTILNKLILSKKIKEKHLEIFKKYAIDGIIQVNLAKMFNISQAQVSRILKRVYFELKKNLKESGSDYRCSLEEKRLRTCS